MNEDKNNGPGASSNKPGERAGSESELIKGDNVQEKTEEVGKKIRKAQAIATISSNIIASLINPMTLIVLGIAFVVSALVFGGLATVQTVGRNDNSCKKGEDCSVAKRVASCEAEGGGLSSSASIEEKAGQAAQAAYSAGFRGKDLLTMVMIAYGESSWNNNATNSYTENGVRHYVYGLWQISDIHGVKEIDMRNPSKNAGEAWKIYKAAGGTGTGGSASRFNAWSAYTGSNWAKIKSDSEQIAIDAIQKVTNGTELSIDESCGSSGGNGTCGPACDKALAGAKAMLNNCDGWNGLCASFVARAAGYGAWCGPVNAWQDGNGSCSAVDGLIQAKKKGVANKVTDWNSVPAGALLLRGPTPGGSIHGHVAIMSDKTGYVITTAAEGAPAGNCIKEYKLSSTSFNINYYYWVDPGQLK